MDKQTIMVVDDDTEIREGIRILLSGENYTILTAESGSRALELLSGAVDLIILDIMMPGMSGLRVCEEIRKTSAVPILFLTAKAQESDKVIGLSAGGDDYLPKPFSYSELNARVKALLRRYCVYRGKAQTGTLSEDNMLSVRGIKISLDYNQVWVCDREVELTETEYNILRLLMENPQRVFSAQNIYESVWNEPYFYISNGTVMVHIRKLRVKIEKDPQNPKLLKTVWGKGYRFEASGDEA
jgi:DNA-binding response OmpR family regulator